MTAIEALFAKITDMNPTHCETLALAVYSTLNGLPREAFEEVARLAEGMGADRLAEFHADMVC